MKKKFIIVLFIALTGSLSLMAQTKKKSKAKTPAKKTTKAPTVKPDTTAKTATAGLPANSQIDSIKSVPDSDDGYLKSIVITKARPFPIFEPSANNIKMYHEYKREMLFKDPRNAKFNTSGATLIEALLQGVQDGIITAYDPTSVPKINPNGDAFTRPLTYKQLIGTMVPTEKRDIIDKETGNVKGSEFVKGEFNPSDIIGYRIKEDVYYDKQRAKVETKIIGIAPLIVDKATNGDTIGTRATCWFKYKQCRIIFAKMDVSDADKNMYDVSMDDMFLQRQFNAPIIYESNPKGVLISEYAKTAEERAKEAARIEKKLADYKNNIWKYQTNITAVSVPDKPKKEKAPAKTKTTPATTPDNNPGAPVKP